MNTARSIACYFISGNKYSISVIKSYTFEVLVLNTRTVRCGVIFGVSTEGTQSAHIHTHYSYSMIRIYPLLLIKVRSDKVV